MRTIGLLGGMSWESTVSYYQIINRSYTPDAAGATLEAITVDVVEYDAFGNITGTQSRSIAILNERGDGLVITLLTYRDDTVFYTKEVRAGRGVQELAPEEQGSVDRALGR